MTPDLTLDRLWEIANFQPNDPQAEAVQHVDGPLYLTAGPGSGKTRVLLWRSLNLIVFHGISPSRIFLATFTEKAALQLREGLQSLLGIVTNHTGVNYDLGEMYIGTIHSQCHRLITDRELQMDRQRVRPPRLLDALAQYFHLANYRNWTALIEAAGLDIDTANETINAVFDRTSASKHSAVTNCINFFNRLAEEQIDPTQASGQLDSDGIVHDYFANHNIDVDGVATLLSLAKGYQELLGQQHLTTFALIQQAALDALSNAPNGRFDHVIIDEYQDTNTIQERLIFRLAGEHANICVVGDDDQSLYRFRGATVENFVQFPQRCLDRLSVEPRRITLSRNYRSREPIVDFYSDFIDRCDWQKDGTNDHFRVMDKNIVANRRCDTPAVVATQSAAAVDAFDEIAELVCALIDEDKVSDPNQIAFLFPSLQYRGQVNTQVRRMKDALEAAGLEVYAPRAGRFLDVPEAIDTIGVFAHIIGTPSRNGQIRGSDYENFREWLDTVDSRGQELIGADPHLAAYVSDRQAEIKSVLADQDALLSVVQHHKWDLQQTYSIEQMKRPLVEAQGLTDRARRILASAHFDRLVMRRAAEGTPYHLAAVINRAVSVDWSLLDLFYRICGFRHFRAMFDLEENGRDEGPICNLALITQYLTRFMDDYVYILTAFNFQDNRLRNRFFGSFLFALYRLGESEFENVDDPFPRGRIPFLTVHQSKGLEFPVVILANPRKNINQPSPIEKMVRPFFRRDEGEPLDRMSEFDVMRMFYVALSRAENLLVLGHLRAQGQYISQPFRNMLDDDFPRIRQLDLGTIPPVDIDDDQLPRSYSYTSDFQAYKKCPRQYMVFRRYDFAASRTQTMFFGSLVHQTLEDLHNLLIAKRTVPS